MLNMLRRAGIWDMTPWIWNWDATTLPARRSLTVHLSVSEALGSCKTTPQRYTAAILQKIPLQLFMLTTTIADGDCEPALTCSITSAKAGRSMEISQDHFCGAISM